MLEHLIPLLLALLLIFIGIIIRIFYKVAIEKWVGYNISAAGIIILLEIFAAKLYPQIIPSMPLINMVTIIVICIIMVIGFGLYG